MQIRTIGELHDTINAQAKEIKQLKSRIENLTASRKRSLAAAIKKIKEER